MNLHTIPLRLVILLALLCPGLALGQTGTLTGHVTDATSGEPIPGANVIVENLLQGAASNVNGAYIIEGLPTGEHTISVSYIGYKQYSMQVTIREGEETVQDIELAEDFLGLEEIVVTGQGAGINKRRLSTTISVVTPKQIAATPAKRIDELLQAQLPNAQVRFSSGQPGTASLIRSRGVTSANSSTTPVIYVDGVRVDNLNTASALDVATGGAQSSAIPDIPLESIERIEFISGGAATTLYGSDAANGVIQIFTKQGLPGRTSFRYENESGWMQGTTDYLRFDRTADIVFEPGFVQQHRLSGSGGVGDMTYSFSGSLYEDNGFRLGNEQIRYGLRSTVGAKVTPITRYVGSFAFASSAYTRDFNANTSFSEFGNLEGGGYGIIDTLNADAFNTLRDDIRNTISLVDISGDTKRFQTSQLMEFTPTERLLIKGTIGLDYRVNVEEDNQSPDYIAAIGGTQPILTRVERRFLGLTLEGAAQHTANVGDLSFVSTVGGQVFRDEDRQGRMIGTDIAQGTSSIDNSAEQTADDFELIVANYGVYFQENIGFKDRYFVEAGLRVDANSAFGEQIGTVPYPKVGAAYALSSEPVFQRIIPAALLSNLKLRGNLGWAGNFPTPFTNDRLVLSAPYLSQNSYTFGQFGNVDLKPERTRTWEVGADFGFLNERMSVEVTYFNALTEDALFTVPFAPSTGRGAQLFNVGEIENKGWEIGTTFFLVAQRNFDLRLNASLNTLDNLVVDNGGTAEFTVGGFSFLGQFVDEGKPVGYLRGARPEFDAEGNFVTTERNAVLGSPLPDGFGTLGLNLTMWNRLRLFATADYQWGAQGVATDDVLRFFQGVPDEGRFPTAPDGSIPALGQASFFDLAGVWVEDTDYFKLRLVSIGYTLPESWYEGIVRSIDLGFRAVAPLSFVTSRFDPEITGANGLNGNGVTQGGVNVGVFGFGTESPPRQYLFNVGIDF